MLNKYTVLILLFLISGFTLFADSLENDMAKAGLSVLEEKSSSIDFTLDNLEGKKISLKDYRGKAVMLNFWATWCPPCRKEMPSMEKLYNKMDKSGFEIVAVNIQEDKKTASDFVEKYNYTFPVLLDIEGQAASIYQIRAIPTTFILDKNGYVRAVFKGTREWDTEEIMNIFKKLASE